MTIYRTIQFTDYSLRKFFEKASSMPWFKNTLFVLTADHCSAQVNYDKYRTASGYFWIPFIFYHGGDNLHGMEVDPAQQTDILPTVLNYLGYDKSYVSFGCDLFDPASEKLVFNYLDETYQLFLGDYLLLFNGDRSIALYKYKTDILLKQNLLSVNHEIRKVMEAKIKAIIQQYNNRMVDDKLSPE